MARRRDSSDLDVHALASDTVFGQVRFLPLPVLYLALLSLL